jgi:peptidoglycan/xylan/chitin deacetylase (PgdA/CDA1 family)
MWVDPLSRRFLKNAGLVSASEGRGPVVLMYHSITPGNSTPDTKWAVSEYRFKEHLALLKSEGWTTVCVRDLLHADSLPPRTVVITFDDGFANNFEHGYRHLVDGGMRATWFVVSRDIGKNSSWTDGNVPSRAMLTDEQLRQMATMGMEIGAHTRTHTRLPGLDTARLKVEIEGSKIDLQEIVGKPVTSFAYPYGLFDEACVTAVKAAGFSAACTVRSGWFGGEKDLLLVRRVAIYSYDSLSAFARKLAFAADMEWWRLAGYMAGRMRVRLGF